ncbi:MAG: kelch repeat-containing protein, partial [Wenzhouxiangella sp.]|nr:kelch repeat-containing protein [Wenzhouxiangella sp.]
MRCNTLLLLTLALYSLVFASRAEAQSWISGPDMNVARADHSATLLPDGRLLVIGGVNQSGLLISSAEIYDPATQQWTLVPNDSAFGRQTHTATLLNDGRVLVVGGAGPFGGALDSVEILDPATGQWQTAASFGRITRHTAVKLNNGDVLVFGGRVDDGFGGLTDFTIGIRYDVSEDEWVFAGAHTLPHRIVGGKLSNGNVVALSLLNSDSAVYNPGTNSWGSTGEF